MVWKSFNSRNLWDFVNVIKKHFTPFFQGNKNVQNAFCSYFKRFSVVKKCISKPRKKSFACFLRGTYFLKNKKLFSKQNGFYWCHEKAKKPFLYDKKMLKKGQCSHFKRVSVVAKCISKPWKKSFACFLRGTRKKEISGLENFQLNKLLRFR